MFHRQDKKKSKSGPMVAIKGLTAIATPLQILATEKRQALIKQIETLSHFDEKRFESLCSTLIHKIANYFQYLPETAHSYYAQSAGMLDYALYRTEAALELFHQYAVLQENETLSPIQELWLYALLSASLLKNIGKLQIDFRIQLFDSNNNPKKRWNPLIETMEHCGHFYQFEFEADDEDKIPLRHRLNLLLARQLMPKTGFQWIASDPNVLATWLALLNDDWLTGKTLGAILIRSDAAAIHRYFNEATLPLGHRRGARQSRIGTFVDGLPESAISKEQLIGIAFIKWLNQSMTSGSLIINKAPLFMVPGGMLVGTEAFRLFLDQNPEYKTLQAIQNGFLSLGLHRVNPDGSVSSRYEQQKTQQMHTGILFPNYAIALPSKVRMQNLYTGSVAPMSDLELIHLVQINHPFTRHYQKQPPKEALQAVNAQGQWKTVSHATLLQSRPTRSG